MRIFILDTLATVLFFSVFAALSESLVAGMPQREVFSTRLIMIPVMILTGRPYGLWRDLIFRYLSPKPGINRILVDTLTFLSFQAPVYALTLLYAGATLEQMVLAVGSAIFLMAIVARPFGIFLEYCRRLGGIRKREEQSPPE